MNSRILIGLVLINSMRLEAQTQPVVKDTPTPAPQNTAQAQLEPKSGSQTKGLVRFMDTPEGIQVEY